MIVEGAHAKDRSIAELVSRLCARFPEEIEVVDHWDADLCAIGFRLKGRPAPLVYVSTWKKETGRFSVVVEESAPAGKKTECEVPDCDFEALCAIISKGTAP